MTEADYLFLAAMAFHPLQRDNIGWDDTLGHWEMVSGAEFPLNHPLLGSIDTSAGARARSPAVGAVERGGVS